jgi:small-conductance mechanosensitive channel
VVVLRNLDGTCLDFLLGVWVVASDMTVVQNEILCAIQSRFAQEGISFPPPAAPVVGQAQSAPN